MKNRFVLFCFSEENSSTNQSPEAETCSPVFIDDVRLNGPAVNIKATESFIHQAMDIIMEDAVKKAIDVKEKVTTLIKFYADSNKFKNIFNMY